MPLFGKKKKKEQGDDIEDPEEEGLFMARGSDQTDMEGATNPSADGESVESEPSDLEAALEVEGEPAPESDEAPIAAAEAEDKSDADDLLSAFQDDDTEADLTDITKDLEDVSIAELLAELREIRATLPAEALEQGEDAA